MAITSSFIYSKYKEMMLGKSLTAGEALSITLSTSIYVALILESHTPDRDASTTGSYRSVFSSRVSNLAEHATWGSVSNDVVLTGVSISSSNGVTYFNAADVATPSVSTGQSVGGILIYRRVGTDADSLPIALIDIGSPVTANGASININWDNGVNRIFSLT